MKTLIGLLLAITLALPAAAFAYANNYLIGRGSYDITGPAAEVSLFGYASLEQIASGIHDRQRARAFIVVDRQNQQKRVVFVNIDSGATFQGVTQGVTAALKSRYGSLYDERNMVISATHTHAAAGGHSHYALYNITTNGYIKQTYDAQVNGIVAAIERAHQDLGPGYILFNRGDLWGANANRSQEAYYSNLDAALYPDVDPQMTVLKLVKNDQPVGMLSWFATHGVSLPPSNTLLSGDNKGYAQYLFEQQMGSDYGNGAFVAAFAQSNSGDMTPNLNLDGTGPGRNPEESVRMIGQMQYDMARQLYEQANEALVGSIDFRHKYYNMSAQTVAGQFTEDGQPHNTCTAALGYGFGAGTEDGRGLDLFKEGQLHGNLFWQALTAMISAPTAAQKACHAPRGLLLAQGNFKPYPWSPEVLPVSLLKIGQLGLLAVPGEFTIMAGRRLRSTVAAIPNTGLSHLLVAGYSNAYAGYVTTNEEYRLGHYEGGSTHFGPWTLAAYRQALFEQASSLASGLPLVRNGEPVPRNLKDAQLTLQTGVVHDQAPLFKSIGDLVQQPSQRYSRGQTASAVFWAGHPKNNLRTQDSFMQVQRLLGGQWQTVATDSDWSTRFRWKRIDGFWGTSQATLEWDIDASVAPGTYRLRHTGTRKAPLTFKLYEYSGNSRSFAVD